MHYCENCDRSYPTWSAYIQHLKISVPHNIVCGKCNIDFATREDRRNHWIQSPYHSYCRFCYTHFDGDDELKDHCDSAHVRCRSCDEFFQSKDSLHEHYQQSPRHFYCLPCKRSFQSRSDLRSHLNSSIHLPRNVKCRGKGCTLKFVSVPAMILHLESGNCVSDVDRKYVNQKVRELDRSKVITGPSRMITEPGSQDDSKCYATDLAWNGCTYECYLCHITYRKLATLNRHLGGMRHNHGFYLCPSTPCSARFGNLRALCRHIERERCGVHKFCAERDPCSRQMDKWFSCDDVQ